MVKVTSTIKINEKKIKEIDEATKKSLEQTAHVILGDIISNGYIPRDQGNLEEDSFVDTNEIQDGKVSIVSTAPYARRIYYNADNWKFQRESSVDHWFESYVSGQDKDYLEQVYKEFLKRN